MKEARIEVKGRVQGIHFRKQIRQYALESGLVGSVMNLAGGSVLIVAQGEKSKINNMIDWVMDNPGFSKVENVDINWSDIDKGVDDFKIVREGNFVSDKVKSVGRLFRRILRLDNIQEKFELIPKHVAIIPDGNRRWAKFRGLEPQFGHYRAGSYSNIESLLKKAKDIGVGYVSIWGFSTENWKRSDGERKAIFDLLAGGVERFIKFAHENKMRFRHIGRKDRLPSDLLKKLNRLEKETEKYKEFNVLLCLDYGGRDELLRAVNNILKEKINKIDEKDFLKYLDTKDIPDPDLIIRTSGENRLSGFMPFQSVYAELYFSEVYFPDFGVKELSEAIREYGRRQRRFGGS
ncbi:MAG: polyprenyl diphosphate synthase [Nanoarchaeota archaeon]|nr:polyprenyl diphosphate synthase [Nanoarchaeota archaeon]